MRGIIVLPAAGAVALSLVWIGYSLSARQPLPTQAASMRAEPAIATGTIGPPSNSQPATLPPAPPAPSARSVASPLPSTAAESAKSSGANPARASIPICDNPNALGVTRTVEIDTTGGPGFGFEHFRQHDFLHDKEVVLTFDDGPWPTTKAVLKALADQCVRATFFAIGKHATYYPEILRSVAEAGHTIGSHTWSHQDLSKKSPEEAKAEIEKAISAVQWALGERGQEASFFRFPALRHPPEMLTYLGERNIAIFSTDIDSFDFKLRQPEQIINSVMTKLQRHGKGIVLLHDFQSGTSHALPQLLAELKAGGYKIVHLKSRSAVATLPQYNEELHREQKLPTVSQLPTSSIMRDIQ